MSEENAELSPLEGNPRGLPEAVLAAGYTGYILSALFDKHG
jgi:hypothetical protein